MANYLHGFTALALALVCGLIRLALPAGTPADIVLLAMYGLAFVGVVILGVTLARRPSQ